ncbi:MAG: hypothetical protein AAF613_08105 [Pseudomonadota bacterium]
MSAFIALLFPMATTAGPVDASLRATEAPETLRAAFTVEMISDKAERTLRFDPRLPEAERWKLIDWKGEDSALDEAAAAWGAEAAPDGRLFPDDLRASLGAEVQVETLGPVWRVGFQHTPSANDTALDVWATQRLSALAWLEPDAGRILRIDYHLPEPVRGPDGGRLTRFEQSYLLESEPIWGLSYISQFKLEFEAKAAFRTVRQSYHATIKDADFFFASVDAEDQYVEQQFQAGARFAAR